MDRIIMHWSAGGHTVSHLDKKHYHFIVDGAGEVHTGDHPVEDNISTKGGYAAHTAMCNTGSIGVSMAAMAGAKDYPFDPGSQPITPKQLGVFIQLVAALAKQFNIPITRQTVLSHAEVQPTLGIKQRGKWDIAWLPGMDKVGDPVEVGDHIRSLVAEANGDVLADVAVPVVSDHRPTLRRGMQGPSVKALQSRLMALGYDVGRWGADGDFGGGTESAVKSLQTAKGLDADGVVGKNTWSAITGD